jgi:hypothetical protein
MWILLELAPIKQEIARIQKLTTSTVLGDAQEVFWLRILEKESPPKHYLSHSQILQILRSTEKTAASLHHPTFTSNAK